MKEALHENAMAWWQQWLIITVLFSRSNECRGVLCVYVTPCRMLKQLHAGRLRLT